MSRPTTYEELIEHNPKIGQILDPDVYKFVRKTNEHTTGKFDKVWERQLRINLKRFYKKHGLLIDNCRGFGFNKAVVALANKMARAGGRAWPIERPTGWPDER